MINSKIFTAAVATTMASAALAQQGGTYSLNAGIVHFRTPTTWTAMMEKSDGDPQAIAFQVPDDSAQGSNDAATVTVKTHQLASATAFAAFVQDEYEHARSQPGFANDPGNKDASIRQYFVHRAGTRYAVRDTATLIATIAVQVRCQRPVLERTPAAWIARFDDACRDVTASLQP